MNTFASTPTNKMQKLRAGLRAARLKLMGEDFKHDTRFKPSHRSPQDSVSTDNAAA